MQSVLFLQGFSADGLNQRLGDSEADARCSLSPSPWLRPSASLCCELFKLESSCSFFMFILSSSLRASSVAIHRSLSLWSAANFEQDDFLDYWMRLGASFAEQLWRGLDSGLVWLEQWPFRCASCPEMCCFYLAKKNADSEQICASADKSENTYYMMYILIYKWYGDDGGLQQHMCIGTIYEVGPMVCYMFIINFLREKVQAKPTHAHILCIHIFVSHCLPKKSNCSLSSNKSGNKHHEIDSCWGEKKELKWHDVRTSPYNSKTTPKQLKLNNLIKPHIYRLFPIEMAFLKNLPDWAQDTSIQWERRSTSKSSLQIIYWQKIQRPTQIIQDDNPPGRWPGWPVDRLGSFHNDLRLVLSRNLRILQHSQLASNWLWIRSKKKGDKKSSFFHHHLMTNQVVSMVSLFFLAPFMSHGNPTSVQQETGDQFDQFQSLRVSELLLTKGRRDPKKPTVCFKNAHGCIRSTVWSFILVPTWIDSFTMFSHQFLIHLL